MTIDADSAYRALHSRDARFDGVFFVGVRTTGIYCRPSCAARTPLRRNVDFYPSAAAAQRSGLRACKRCRPDATPGSADWNTRADLAGRAVRLIADGVIDREGVGGLASRLGYSERQVTRALVTELGAPPLALARAQRAQTARILLERTTMPAADVAFAAGFSSVRQFNDTVREVFDATPSRLRAAHRAGPAEPGVIELRLPYRAQLDLTGTIDFLLRHAVDGLETGCLPDPTVQQRRRGLDDTSTLSYARVLSLPHAAALVRLSEGDGHVRAELHLDDHRDLSAAVSRVRRLLDLDADPVAINDVLARQRPLQPLVTLRPGLRSPGAVDAFEAVVRTIVGQQISLAGARTVLSRIVAEHGRAVPGFGSGTHHPQEGVADAAPPGMAWRAFPTADVLAGLDPATLPMPRSRGRTVVEVAAAMASGELVLDPGSDRERVRHQLLGYRGIGPWTADLLVMRTTGDPDVFVGGDLAIKAVLARLEGAQDLDIAATAPWRSYLTHHLWAHFLAGEPATTARDGA